MKWAALVEELKIDEMGRTRDAGIIRAHQHLQPQTHFVFRAIEQRRDESSHVRLDIGEILPGRDDEIRMSDLALFDLVAMVEHASRNLTGPDSSTAEACRWHRVFLVDALGEELVDEANRL